MKKGVGRGSWRPRRVPVAGILPWDLQERGSGCVLRSRRGSDQAAGEQAGPTVPGVSQLLQAAQLHLCPPTSQPALLGADPGTLSGSALESRLLGRGHAGMEARGGTGHAGEGVEGCTGLEGWAGAGAALSRASQILHLALVGRGPLGTGWKEGRQAGIHGAPQAGWGPPSPGPLGYHPHCPPLACYHGQLCL